MQLTGNFFWGSGIIKLRKTGVGRYRTVPLRDGLRHLSVMWNHGCGRYVIHCLVPDRCYRI